VRHHLLLFLREESEQRGATVLYATHIFDGLGAFPTHIAHLHMGALTTTTPIPWPIAPDHPGLPTSLVGKTGYGLWDLALAWLEDDRERRLKAGVARTRGARNENGVPTDSETFYRKYDYSH